MDWATLCIDVPSAFTPRWFISLTSFVSMRVSLRITSLSNSSKVPNSSSCCFKFTDCLQLIVLRMAILHGFENRGKPYDGFHVLSDVHVEQRLP